jgi:hypothetical protein
MSIALSARASHQRARRASEPSPSVFPNRRDFFQANCVRCSLVMARHGFPEFSSALNRCSEIGCYTCALKREGCMKIRWLASVLTLLTVPGIAFSLSTVPERPIMRSTLNGVWVCYSAEGSARLEVNPDGTGFVIFEPARGRPEYRSMIITPIGLTTVIVFYKTRGHKSRDGVLIED